MHKSTSLTRLRIFPVKFARTLVDLYPQLIKTPKGLPADPPTLLPALETFLTIPADKADQWPFAGLSEVYAYLRRSKHLRIPAEWVAHIPRSI